VFTKGGSYSCLLFYLEIYNDAKVPIYNEYNYTGFRIAAW